MNGRSRANYGIDAPPALAGLGAGAVALIGVAALVAATTSGWWWLLPAVPAAVFVFSCVSYVYTTRRGKFAVWAGLLADLQLTGRETVVDLGCGRGAVLNLVARRVPEGHAVGMDLWRSVDQSGNDPSTALANAATEGVPVTLLTADMRALPLATASVDVVLSSMAIHNIHQRTGRMSVIAEAARILRPGGRLVVADFQHTSAYAKQLAGLGLTGVTVRGAGWRFWYGGPWAGTGVVTATRAQK